MHIQNIYAYIAYHINTEWSRMFMQGDSKKRMYDQYYSICSVLGEKSPLVQGNINFGTKMQTPNHFILY